MKFFWKAKNILQCNHKLLVLSIENLLVLLVFNKIKQKGF